MICSLSLRCVVKTDINDYFKENELPVDVSDQEIDSKKKMPESSAKPEQKTISGPKTELEWKVHDCGINKIQKRFPSLLWHSNQDWSFSKEISGFDAFIFSKIVKDRFRHEEELTELRYVEERILEDRTDQDERLADKPSSKSDVSTQITTQRINAA